MGKEMRKTAAILALALSVALGGCGSAPAEAMADAEEQESAPEDEGMDIENREDGREGEEGAGEGGEEFPNGTAEEEISEGNGDAEDKNAEEGIVEGTVKEKDGEQGTEGKGPETEERKEPQLADYEITVFENTQIMYASNPVNVRKGPATDFERVGGLSRGQEASVTGQADTGWYEISFGEGKAFVSNRYLQKEKPEEEPAAQPEGETPSPPAADAGPAEEVKNAAGVIMVGDSRFVQMQQSIGENSCTWIAENGKGYDWFRETAVAKIDGCVGTGSKVLINLGVNDPGHVKDYVELVNAKAAEWVGKGAQVYYASVNPVWENPYTTEEQVQYFNSQMQAGLSGDVHWIDSHSYLDGAGYKLVDGLHFDAETYQSLYAYFMGCL